MDCPTCDENFDTGRSMKIHHKLSHGESIAKEETSCDNCGDVFEYYPSSTNGIYCPECVESDEVWWGASLSGEDNPMFGVTGREHPMYGVRGEDSPTWKGGLVAGYNGKWNNNRNEARRRDGYECRKCGKSEDELERQLDVHHIKPLREFDNTEKAHSLDNLVSLCRVCHGKVEHGDLEVSE